jgi:hypothetical protein
MPNHTGRLLLTTVDPQAAPDAALVIAALSGAGFIADPLRGPDRAFAVGPAFLSLLAFTGCAVAIASEPGDDGNTPCCRVSLPPLASAPRFLWGRNTRPPRCPVCRALLHDWGRRLQGWSDHPHRGATCPSCGETRPPWRWDWKEQAGFGRLFVAVEEGFPREAVPMPRLFDVLTRACGSGWRHFYAQD